MPCPSALRSYLRHGMIGTCLAGLCVALVGLQAGRGEEPTAKEREEGYVSLFNGKDFSGWRFSGAKSDSPADAPNWKVEGGVIHLTGGGKPHLATDKEYADFDLRLEWRAL